MFDEDDFDNSAIDLNRVRKLAGLPDVGIEDAGDTTYEPEDSFDLGAEDVEGSADMGSPIDPVAIDAPTMAPEMEIGVDAAPAPLTMGSEQNHWSMMLADLEQQMPDIPVGDFREVIDSLRRLANYAEDIRRTLVTEGRRSLKSYVAEAMQGVGTTGTTGTTTTKPTAPIKPGNPNDQQTIGNNRQEAIKALQTRMGGKPEDAVKAQKVFNNMQRKGMVKAAGAGFTMQTMDDDQFANALNDPQLNQ